MEGFDYRKELVELYNDAKPDFEKRLKVLALMEKVGGFVSSVNPEGSDDEPRDLSKPDSIASKVLRTINS